MYTGTTLCGPRCTRGTTSCGTACTPEPHYVVPQYEKWKVLHTPSGLLQMKRRASNNFLCSVLANCVLDRMVFLVGHADNSNLKCGGRVHGGPHDVVPVYTPDHIIWSPVYTPDHIIWSRCTRPTTLCGSPCTHPPHFARDLATFTDIFTDKQSSLGTETGLLRCVSKND